MPLLLDPHGAPLVLCHGTREAFDRLDPGRTVDGGLHFGTEAQARMRAGRQGRLVQAHLEVRSARRSRDRGGDWKARIAQAKADGHDAIVYLNRYEGMPLSRALEAREEGVDLDALTDAQFRRRVPEATDSWIVFSVDQVRPLPPPQAAPSPRSPPRPGR